MGKKLAIKRFLRYTGGGTTSAVAAVLLIGSYGGFELPWIFSYFATIGFKRSFLLLLIGIAFLLIHKVYVCRSLCLVVLAFVSASLHSRFEGMDVAIEDGFIRFLMVPDTLILRAMPINSAVLLGLLALALLMTSGRKEASVYIFASILAGLSAVIGAVSLIGYVQNYDLSYGWGKISQMQPETALTFVFIGLSCCIYFIQVTRYQSEYVPGWPAILMFLFGTTATLLVFNKALQDELDHVRRSTAAAADHFRDLIETKIRSRGNALERMARRWTMSGEIAEGIWYDDVLQTIEDLPGFEVIGKTNVSGRIALLKRSREIGPSNTEEIMVISKAIKSLQEQISVDAGFRATNAFELNDRATAFAIVAPVFRSQTYDGLIFAVFDSQNLFKALVDEKDVLPNFVFYIMANDLPLYIRDNQPKIQATAHPILVPRTINLGGHSWTMSVFPKAKYIEDRQAGLATSILFGGTFTSALLGMLVYLLRLAMLKSKNAQVLSDRLQAILDGSTRVSIITTDLEGTITLFNSGAEKMLGYQSEELVGKANALVFHLNSELEQHGHALAQDLETMEPFAALTHAARNGEFEERTWTYVRKNGTMFPVNLIVTAIYENDTLSGFLEIAIDGTKTEKQLRNYARKLEQSNKELEEFSYVASHDLKEPIRNLISYSKLLEDDIGSDLPQDAADDLEFIKDAARRMETLVDDLLHLSRAGRSAMNIIDVDLADIIEEVKMNFLTKIEETKTVIKIPTICPVLHGDKSMLLQLFSNLIANAIKFVAKDTEPLIEIICTAKENGFLVEVKDNGIGMKPEYLKQIFLPFKRLHGMNKYEGSGIGLSICRKIVERHSGSIWVESEPGVGTSFFILFPY